MKTIVQFRLRQEGGDIRWKNPRTFEPDETPEYPEIGELVSPPESIGGGDCIVTEITEVLRPEVADGPEANIITVILRRLPK
jgi:hypothetical protein